MKTEKKLIHATEIGEGSESYQRLIRIWYIHRQGSHLAKNFVFKIVQLKSNFKCSAYPLLTKTYNFYSLSPRWLSFTDVSSDGSSLHKILRKRDGNMQTFLLYNWYSRPVASALAFFCPYCVSIQWQGLVLPPQNPPSLSLRPRLRSSWRSWAGPKGTFGIAADQMYSSGLCSLCTWAMMNRWV